MSDPAVPPVSGERVPRRRGGTLRRLFLALFLRGRTSRGLQKKFLPKSVGGRLAGTLATYGPSSALLDAFSADRYFRALPRSARDDVQLPGAVCGVVLGGRCCSTKRRRTSAAPARRAAGFVVGQNQRPGRGFLVGRARLQHRRLHHRLPGQGRRSGLPVGAPGSGGPRGRVGARPAWCWLTRSVCGGADESGWKR